MPFEILDQVGSPSAAELRHRAAEALRALADALDAFWAPAATEQDQPQPIVDDDEILTVAEVSAEFKRSPAFIRMQCATGRLKAMKAGHRYRIRRSAMLAYERRRTGTGTCRAAVVVMLALLGSVACSSPTAPDYAGVPLVFEGVPVPADRQAAALAEWDFQAACTGFRRKVTGPLPVEAHQGFFACVGQTGSVPVNGCSMFASGWGMGRIQVNALTFVPAVSHELIHWMRDLPDPEHTDPVWDRCDHLHDRGKK